MNRQYIVTERAHFMCPNMSFGLLCTIEQKVDLKKVKETLGILSEAHPLLKAVVQDDENKNPYYFIRDDLEIECKEMQSIETIHEDYHDTIQRSWNVYQERLLRVLIYPDNTRFQILFLAHHLLCDGRGLLELALEFADCYVKGIQPVYVKETLIHSLADLPDGSDLPWISKAVINSANKQWMKENHAVSYEEYLQFEQDYFEKNYTSLEFTKKSEKDLEVLKNVCHNHKISINDYLIAEMMLKYSTNKVVIAADIRKHLKNYQVGSVGNFATAFSVVCKTKTKDVIELAKEVSIRVKKHLQSPSKLMLV